MSGSNGSVGRKPGGGFLVVGIAAAAGVALAATATLFLVRHQPPAPATPAPALAAPSPPRVVAVTPPRPTDPIVDLVDRQSRDPAFRADLADAIELLPAIALQPDEQLARGFKLVSNGFDFQAVPDTATTFRYPLPGQTYKSIILAEFLNAGYLAGKAQSFEVDAAGNKVTLVMWAFTDEVGADRGFRALRDLTGRPSKPSRLAPGAITIESPQRRLSEVLWRHGRLLLSSTYVAREPSAINRGALLRNEVISLLDGRARVFEGRTPEPPPASAAEREMRRFRVPDSVMPGGLSTRKTPAHGSFSADPTRRSGTESPLERSLTGARFVGSTAQHIGFAGRHSGEYGLYAWMFEDGAAARRALDLFLESRRIGSRSTLRVDPQFPDASLVESPNGPAYAEFFWVRGTTVLQAGMYGSAEAPLDPRTHVRLALLLDAAAIRP